MEDKDSIAKLEITGFTNSEIRPELKEDRSMVVNAQPGWYSGPLEKAVGAARKVRNKLTLRRTDEGAEEDLRTVRSLLFKTAVCACIALLLLLVKNINSPFTNEITQGIKTAINTETDLEKEIGRLKFVQNLFGSEPVLSEITEKTYAYPVEGKVTKKFGEDGSSGIAVETSLYSPVICAAAGKVIALSGEDEGLNLRVQLEDGTEIVYGGVVPRVKEGDTVKKGGILGTLKGNTLNLAVYQKGKAVDPLEFLSKRGVQKE